MGVRMRRVGVRMRDHVDEKVCGCELSVCGCEDRRVYCMGG